MVSLNKRQAKKIFNQMMTNLCPNKSYWVDDIEPYGSSVHSFWRLIVRVSNDMGIPLNDFLHMCGEGSLTDKQIHSFIKACHLELSFEHISFSKQEDISSLLEQTRNKLFLYADNEGITGTTLEKDINTIVDRYNYMKLGEYYFYRVAFDTINDDFNKNVFMKKSSDCYL